MAIVADKKQSARLGRTTTAPVRSSPGRRWKRSAWAGVVHCATSNITKRPERCATPASPDRHTRLCPCWWGHPCRCPRCQPATAVDQLFCAPIVLLLCFQGIPRFAAASYAKNPAKKGF